MKAEHAAALKYIFQDEVYLLPNEKSLTPPTVAPAAAPTTIARPELVALPVTPLPVIETAPEPVTPPVAASTPVIPKTETAPVVQTQVAGFNYLGANKKAFLIFTYYPEHEFIAAEHLTALQNILKRKGVSQHDVAILNVAKTPGSKWADIYKFFTPKKVLVLGKDAAPAGLNLPPLNTLKQAPSASLLYSFSFDEMMSSNDNKKAFWDQMKNL